MLVSSTSMKAASATTTAISQGLYLGRQMSWSSVSGGGTHLQVHVRHHVHAGAKPMIAVFSPGSRTIFTGILWTIFT